MFQQVLNIERFSYGESGFNDTIQWDIETPANWLSEEFLARNYRNKFLTKFLLDWFKGKKIKRTSILISL